MQNYCKYSIKSHDRYHKIEQGGRNVSATFTKKDRYRRSVDGGNALQLYSNGCGQGIDADGSAAGLIVFEILGVDLIVGVKIAFHIHKKYGDIYEPVPATATFVKNDTDIVEYAAALCSEVELLEIAVFIAHQTGDLIGTGLTRPYTREEQQVANALGVRIQTYGFRSFICRE